MTKSSITGAAPVSLSPLAHGTRVFEKTNDNTMRFAFPLAGHDTYTPQELDNLLKRAILSKHDKMQRAQKSFFEEFGGDAPTFIVTALDPTNVINWFLSGAATDVVLHFKEKFSRKHKTLHNLLNVWVDNRKALRANNIPNATAFKQTEQSLRDFGIGLEDIAEYTAADFDEKTFVKLHSVYNSSLSTRTKARLKRPIKENIRKTLPAMGAHFKKAVTASVEFIRGVGHNFGNPKKMRTLKAVFNGVKSWGKIVALRGKNFARGFDSKHKQLRVLKKEYQASPIELKHWDRAIQIEDSIDERTQLAGKTARRFVLANAFFAGNVYELLNNDLEHAAQDNYIPLLTHFASAVLAVGPIKELGEELTHTYNILNSALAQMAHDYIRLHEDRKEVEKHPTLQDGLRALSL